MKKIRQIDVFLLFRCTLCSFILLFCCTNSLLAQNPNVTIKEDAITIKDFLSKLEDQTDYNFAFSNDVIDLQKKITVSATNENVSKLLTRVIPNISLKVENNKIIILKKEVAKTAIKENREITGSVVDENNIPLLGVTVFIKGTTTGTATNIDGKFNISAATGNEIVFEYIGYQTQRVSINSQSVYDIKMATAANDLDAVVVTALGIKRATKVLSYNVQEVKSDEVNVVKDANFMNSLQGKVAGVQISSAAGGIGAAVRVVMRGSKSISKDNNALYVIDGIPMFNVTSSESSGSMFSNQSSTDGVADLNPDDIQSISMLTGPSAAALYGSNAANGVVLVTTKRGSSEKTTVTFTNNTMFSTPYIMPEMQNEYGNTPGMYQSWGEKTTNRYDPANFFNTGSNIMNSITFSTGTKKNQTYASVSSTNGSGMIPNNTYDRYNFSIRNTAHILDSKLILDLGANYIIQQDKNMVGQGQYQNPLLAVYLFPRNDSFDEIRAFERHSIGRDIALQHWPYGDEGLSLQNPYWQQYRMNRESNKKRYMLNANLTYHIADWINVTGRVQVDNTNTHFTRKEYASTHKVGANGFYAEDRQENTQTYADAMVNIDKKFGDFSLNANIGGVISDTRYELIGNLGNLGKLPNYFTITNINFSSAFKPRQYGYHDQTQSVFANIELGWRDMIYATVTGRNEWSSALAFSDTPSYFYPSVGISAIVSEMAELPKFINYLKVRGSYTNVATAFDRFLTRPGYEFDEMNHGWNSSTIMPASVLEPESTTSWEIGLNTRLWNHFNIDFTYYNSDTTNQTFFIDLPVSSGFKSYVVQAGSIGNKGVELSLGYNNKWNDFVMSTNFTFTKNVNTVNRLASDVINLSTGMPIIMDEMRVATLGGTNAPEVILREGGSMHDIYVKQGLKTDANGNIWVDSQTGQLAVVEYDEYKKLGSMNPDFNMGLNQNFSYKGINFGVVIAASVGGLVVSNTQGILDFFGASKTTADARDAGGVWINNGYVDAKKYYQTIGTATGGLGEYYTYDATNIRIQELNLSYTLPRKWIGDRVKLTAGFVARNLLMIYNKAPFDPGITPSATSSFYQGVDYFMQPSSRNIGFNVKLQF